MRQEIRGSRARVFERPAVAALYAAAVAILALAAGRSLMRAHQDRMHDRTGRAEWIWYSAEIPRPRPLRFVATRDFVLTRAPERATAKVFVDAEHVLFVNGRRAGGGAQRPGDPLRLYDVAADLEPGVNRIAIVASSPTGIGGILFALDLDAYGRNAVTSDSRWRVDLEPSAVTRGGRYRPVVWGSPPQYPWGYPRMPRPNELE